MIELALLVIVVAILGVLWFVCRGVLWLTDLIITHYRRNWLAKLKGKLIARGLHFVVNTDADVTAVALKSEFQPCLERYIEDVDFAADGSKAHKPWDKVVCWVTSTYTFASSTETQRPVHTGTRDDLERIAKLYIEHVTGVHPRDLSEGELSEVMAIIVRKDPRLFVPYSGKLTGTIGEEQYAYYGHRDLADFRDLFPWTK